MSTLTPRCYARIAGYSLLLMTILAIIGQTALQPLHSVAEATGPGGLPETLSGIRLGILAFGIITLLDIIVAWALYYLFEPLRSPLLNLSLLLRALYAMVIPVALAPLLIALETGTDIATHLSLFNTIWMMGLGIFGFHLMFLGMALWGKTFIHKIFPILLVIAGFGYTADTAALILGLKTNIALYTFFGELLFMGWLLARGGKADQGVPQ